MGDLAPLAFDLETSGLEPGAVITVAGIAADSGAWLALNTIGRPADAHHLETQLETQTASTVQVVVEEDEAGLLTVLNKFADTRIDSDRHYLTAYNGETWNNGFDLPFLRRACVRRNVAWPFPEMAYADVLDMIDRIETGDVNDLAGVYDQLIENDHCDPFTDSGSAVAAHKEGDWVNLLLHNLADIQRTRQLAVLAGEYVPKSDFNMKSLTPPDV